MPRTPEPSRSPVTASCSRSRTAPEEAGARIYRTALEPGSTFERCTEGLPEWFEGNIDSGWLDARGSEVAFGTGDGEVYVSDDAGERWTRAAADLPSIRAVRLV